MNEKELAEIEARVQALFKGEWVEETDENGDEWIRIPGGHDVKFWNIEGSSGCCYAVTHFIAHARQDVPALVAEVRRLRAALDFYASSDSYIMQDFVIEFTSEIMMDQGKHARNALAGDK